MNLYLKIPDILDMASKIPNASLPPSLDAGGQAVLDARVRSVYLSLSVQRSHRFPYSTIKKPPKSNLYALLGNYTGHLSPLLALFSIQHAASNRKAI